jgi:HSP20 family protein
MSDLAPVHRSSAPARQDPEGRWPRSRFDPFGDFEELWDRMVSRFFDTSWRADVAQAWTPLVDVEETQDAWIFEAELPGASRDDVQVDFGNGELTISGQVAEREHASTMRRRTRRLGRFLYRTTLPAGVDPDGAGARFDNGVLTVRVPRPEAKGRRIKIT